MVALAVFAPGTKVLHRGCPDCPPATVLKVADGQVYIRFADGRETYTEKDALVVGR